MLRHMQRPLLALFVLFLAGSAGHAQTLGGGSMKVFSGAPSGSCQAPQLAVNSSNGLLYSCAGGVWTLVTSVGVAAGNAGTLQFNSANALAGITKWTTNGTTNITAAAGAGLDLRLIAPNGSPTGGLYLPSLAGAAPTADGMLGFNTTNHCLVYGSAGTTVTLCSGGGGGSGVTSFNARTGVVTLVNADLGGLTAPLATALAATPTNCGAGIAATGVAASGNAVGCFTPTTGFATLTPGTNTGTGFIFAPSATGTVPVKIMAPSGMTANLFEVDLNGVSQFAVTPTGLTFPGTSIDLGSNASTAAGRFGCHGGNTNTLPCSIQLFNNADGLSVNLSATNTNGRASMQQGIGSVDIVQNYITISPQVSNQAGTSYAILATDYGKLITFKNAGAIAVSLPRAGFLAGVADVSYAGFGAGWYVDLCTQRLSGGSATITPATSTIDDGALNLVLAPGICARVISGGTNYEVRH